MIVFFRKLSLTLKLLLIGIVPIVFLIYFSIIIYSEKTKKLELIGAYVERVEQSANISELINELGRERRYSYQYILKKSDHQFVVLHRSKTDSIIKVLKKSPDLALQHFAQYTFLNKLGEIRSSIDTNKDYPPDAIIQFYTDAIVRLNTINLVIPSNTFLKPVYQDLIAQKNLSEMITYFQIIRTNIFNVLFSRKFMQETLLGTLGVYKIYKSYETEFLIKASPNSVSLYNNRKKLTEFGSVNAYTDRLFTTFTFDSTFNADQWWDASTQAVIVLRRQQRDLWQSVDTRMKQIYSSEKTSKNLTLIFLLIAILFVIGFVAYFIKDITILLRELKLAARKISKGETGLNLTNMPSGVIGTLARSIRQIDKNNVTLANAANEIGKGNFDVNVKPRSDADLLGMSIKKMQQNLQEFASQKDRIQKATEELVYKRDEFFSVASHELKTPVTSLKAYTQLLLMNASKTADPQGIKMLERMNVQINKLTSLINDLLDTSKLQNGQIAYHKEKFHLNTLIEEIIEEIQPTSPETRITFESTYDGELFADRDRIGQVISNLLVNAIKYAPNCKKINVKSEKHDNNLICSVHDFGNGILPDEYNKIFERFYRISGNNLNTFPGLGLGLFISKDIIEKHGGKIWVESEKGKGTTFFFELVSI